MKFDCKVCTVLQFYLPAVAKEITCFNCERVFNVTNNFSHRRPSFQNDSRASTPLPLTNGIHESQNGHSSHQEPQDVFIQPRPPAPKKIEEPLNKEESFRKSPESSNGMDYDEDDESISSTSIESVSKRGRKRKKTERLVQLELEETTKRPKPDSPNVSFRNSPLIPKQPHPNNTCGGCSKRLSSIPDFKKAVTQCIDCIRWFCKTCSDEYLQKTEDDEFSHCKAKSRCFPTARGRAKLKNSPGKAIQLPSKSKPKQRTISSEPTANGIKIRNWANGPPKRRQPRKPTPAPAIGTIVMCSHTWCTYVVSITELNQRRAKNALKLHERRCRDQFKKGKRLEFNPKGKSTYVSISKFGLAHKTGIKTEPLTMSELALPSATVEEIPNKEHTELDQTYKPLLLGQELGVKSEIIENPGLLFTEEDEWSTDEEGGSSGEEELEQNDESPPHMLDMLEDMHSEVPANTVTAIPVATNGNDITADPVN
ncbi:unnamed protein product [Oikopleura dioica]|uniref:Uncharacterized protein n=1 Tax=Oikopleura dioica TaxID=34765 RepID=E4XG78_OIKDI|nr:unnamed protein product [Oikopleura dioica]